MDNDDFTMKSQIEQLPETADAKLKALADKLDDIEALIEELFGKLDDLETPYTTRERDEESID